jgi:protocatechuate 3,4-dioxygenase beta subunit
MNRIRRLVIALAIAAWTCLAPAVGVGAAPAPCAPTRPDAEGPFYEPNAPERSRTGRGLVVSGAVRSASDCRLLASARIEWWSTNTQGRYDDDHRATQRADDQGRYRYETDFPARYPGRPPHLHVRVSAAGHRPLVTQIYPRAGQTAVDFDFVLVPE